MLCEEIIVPIRFIILCFYFDVLADDCFELGKIAYNKDDFYHCIMWMYEALNSNTISDENTVPRAKIFDYLSFALYKVINLLYLLYLSLRFEIFKTNFIEMLLNK